MYSNDVFFFTKYVTFDENLSNFGQLENWTTYMKVDGNTSTLSPKIKLSVHKKNSKR